MVRRYGIVIREIIEDDPEEWKIFRRHRETDVLSSILGEQDFNLKAILRAILEGVEHAEKKL
jgi:hypothetical protein